MNKHTSHLPTTAEPFDDTAKDFYRKLFEEWGLTVETQREVFFRGRAIDLVVTCPTAEQRHRLQSTRFAHFRRLNALEFKGIHDPLTIQDYNKIMMRAWGLGAVQKKKTKKNRPDLGVILKTEDTQDPELSNRHLNQLPSQRTLTIICVTKPDKILELPKEFRFQTTAETGIYYCPARIAQWLICPTELELKPINYPLLPLARGKKLADFIALCFKEGLLDYISLTLRIGLTADPLTIWQKILEVQRMQTHDVEVHEAVIPYIERYFQAFPEDLRRLSITNALLAEKLQQGMQQGMQQGKQQGIQQLLLRQLQRKFTGFPDAIRQRIEATTNLEQLETWSIQVMMANSLAETELGSCTT
jgi:Domain of unknown function (DUF4351)